MTWIAVCCYPLLKNSGVVRLDSRPLLHPLERLLIQLWMLLNPICCNLVIGPHPKGRVATALAFEHLNIPDPRIEQAKLF